MSSRWSLLALYALVHAHSSKLQNSMEPNVTCAHCQVAAYSQGFKVVAGAPGSPQDWSAQPSVAGKALGAGRAEGGDRMDRMDRMDAGRVEGGDTDRKCEEGTSRKDRACEEGTDETSEEGSASEEGSEVHGHDLDDGGQQPSHSGSSTNHDEPMYLCMLTSEQNQTLQVQPTHLDPKYLNKPSVFCGKSRQEYEDWIFSTRSYMQIHGLFTVDQLKMVETSRHPIDLRQLAPDEQIRASELWHLSTHPDLPQQGHEDPPPGAADERPGGMAPACA